MTDLFFHPNDRVVPHQMGKRNIAVLSFKNAFMFKLAKNTGR